MQNDSASVPPSGSNALRTSSKTNIHNGNSSSSTGTTNGTSSGDSKSELRVSCASGISSNGNCSTLTNGHGHSNGHVNGHGHSLANHHGSSSGITISTTANGTTSTLNGRHNIMRNSEEGNNNGSSVVLNGGGAVNGIVANGHGSHSLTNGQSITTSNSTGSLRVQSHKLPLLHTNNNS